MDGEDNSHASFSKFAAWAQQVGVDMPVGVELGFDGACGQGMSCGFVFADGRRCACEHFVPVAAAPTSSLTVQFCSRCEHKLSMHAQRAAPGHRSTLPAYWSDAGGLLELG